MWGITFSLCTSCWYSPVAVTWGFIRLSGSVGYVMCLTCDSFSFFGASGLLHLRHYSVTTAEYHCQGFGHSAKLCRPCIHHSLFPRVWFSSTPVNTGKIVGFFSIKLMEKFGNLSGVFMEKTINLITRTDSVEIRDCKGPNIVSCEGSPACKKQALGQHTVGSQNTVGWKFRMKKKTAYPFTTSS